MSNQRQKPAPRKGSIMAAVIAILAVAAAFVVLLGRSRCLTVRDASTGRLYGAYPLAEGEWFSVGFIHSVNKSPVIDCYLIKNQHIFVEKTVYYGFGAGVQTEIEDGQTLTYGEDGSMIVTGFDRQMDNLTYFVGTVSDHTLTLNEGKEVSLRELCGRNARVRFGYETLWFWEK